jgi:hypothetical protein
MPRQVVSVTVDDSDPRDPGARCDRCGTLGTIARATRHTDPPLILRYCSPCWPFAETEIEERKREERGRWTISSRSWHDARRFLAMLGQLPREGASPTPQHLATLAAEIRVGAGEMDGPIPSDIADFLASHTLPPNPIE